MQTLARCGLQTALVTGGLLMLGTGIASAEENVNPDRPASPLDPRIKIPVRIHDNAIGTPLGQLNTPHVHRDIKVSADELTMKLPAGKATSLGSGSLAKAKGVAGKAKNVAARLPRSGVTQPRLNAANDLFRGNKVPIEIAGNAIAAGGDAHVDATSSENDTVYRPVWTNGSGAVLAGDVVELDWALPVRMSGNAVVAALGNATTNFVSDNTTIAGGDIVTKGTCDAATLVGGADCAGGDTDTLTKAGGSTTTNGDKSTGGGTIAAVPLAVPAQVFANSIAGGGLTNVHHENIDKATAGGQSLTSGNDAVLAGTNANAPVTGPAEVFGSALGIAKTDSLDTVTTKAGGDAFANAVSSVASGSIVHPAVALPVEVFGTAAAVGGEAVALVGEHKSATAGGGQIVHADKSVLSGTAVTPAVTGPVQVLSTAAGNVAAVPVALPSQVFGLAAGALGKATAWASGDTSSTSGGAITTDGKYGTVSGNVASVPDAAAAQASGWAASVARIVSSTDDNTTGPNDSMVHSGGDIMTNGDHGSISGNLVDVPTAAAAQVSGNAMGIAPNQTTVLAGGDGRTSGEDGSISGNLFAEPVAAVAQVFDIPIPILAHAMTYAPNTTVVKVDDTVPLIDLPIGGGGLPINKLPSLPVRGMLGKKQSRSNPPGAPLGGIKLPDSSPSGVAGPINGSALSSLDITQVLSALDVTKLPPGSEPG
ncbi:hypothetical protein [Actinocrispum wychmicini]|uniref:Small secreted domain DUF320 n=1 Tax=Actinocrispum wychmicini TaxID=1213861 RepID=A0A4R2JZH4_9PSEU|nr:hypothetical protein [Actinocrispum wychmicini]TCO64702.1 hypothetical protein EV192_101484 [Actinocrispum wychmicini]